jgi:hypothetical protein
MKLTIAVSQARNDSDWPKFVTGIFPALIAPINKSIV